MGVRSGCGGVCGTALHGPHRRRRHLRRAVEPAALDEDRGLPDELTGTWAIEDGDLRWGFDRYGGDQAVVEGFDALTLESSEFTLQFPGIFEANDGTDDPAEEQDFLVDANGTDSVTLRVRTGAPWTCDRQ